MERVQHQRDAEVISHALDFMPWGLRQLVEDGQIHFFIGDPVFAGLEEYKILSNGHDVYSVPHCIYPDLVRSGPKVPTIVLPKPKFVWWESIWHEMGHAAHCWIGFPDLDLPYVSEYARIDVNETFAEAFCAWLNLDRWSEEWMGLSHLTRDHLRRLDHALSAF